MCSYKQHHLMHGVCRKVCILVPPCKIGRDDFNLTFMIFSGELPYDVGYPKKHIRPYGGGSPCIRIGVMKDNFVFDHILQFSDYKDAQLG